ncbi:MAG TPA: hypothetical protein VFC19_02550 [Candidatus Limnocylindrales bacterium]|nr:hypothetical protein [Candidatus Limnocylindrales bacterium]
MSRRASLLRSPSFWMMAAFVGRQLNGADNLRRNLRWLAVHQDARKPSNTLPPIHFIIPVLAEQDHIEPAMRWFCDLMAHLPNSTLTFATTTREQRQRDALIDRLDGTPAWRIRSRTVPGLTGSQAALLRDKACATGGVLSANDAREVLGDHQPLTSEVVDRQVHQARRHGLAVFHAHYEGLGRKAAQVNHAVAGLTAAQDDYIAVYDVDSRPEIELFERTAALVRDRVRQDGITPSVIQQSARFEVPAVAAPSWRTTLCRGAALSQTL